MKTVEGIVLEIDGRYALVRAGRHSDCEKCGACPGNNSSVITVRNAVNARIGQCVLFEIKDKQSLKGAFLIFILPLIALLFGSILGGFIFSHISLNIPLGRITGGALFLVLAVILIKFLDKKQSGSGGVPAIVEIIH